MPAARCCCASGGAANTLANRVSGYAALTALRSGRSYNTPAAANWIGCHAALVARARSGYGFAGFGAAAFEPCALSGGAEKLDLLGRERTLVTLRVCASAMSRHAALGCRTIPGYPALGAMRIRCEA